MRILFCCDPFSPRVVDGAFAAEFAAAQAAGLATALIRYESLVDEQDAMAAVRGVPPGNATNKHDTAIYRGWMIRSEVYAQLYDALVERGLQLVNTPSAYHHCHELPASYAVIEAHTPRTVWLSRETIGSLDTILAALRPFGDSPVILKDYVKSRKHEWNDACYISSAADADAVARVVERFRALQGDDLVGGLVFRQFVGFAPLGTHSRSGMPLTREYRLFYLDRQRLLTTPYWEEGDYGESPVPADLFAGVARRVRSRFFTMDVAQCLDGTWQIIELGDGQVAGLPTRADPAELYGGLAARLRAL